MHRRNVLTGFVSLIGISIAGCLEEDEQEVSADDLDPIVTIGTPINADLTYSVTVNGQPNRADHVEIEHENEVVYTMTEEIDDPETVVEDAEEGDLIRAIAVEDDTKEIVEEREVM